MRKAVLLLSLGLLVFALTFAYSPSAVQAQSGNACWGQATKEFARMGVMGEHASQFETPRLGLRNLARALYEQGVIPDDTMQALGGFVVAELGLTVEACE